jgi:hypothetical protein
METPQLSTVGKEFKEFEEFGSSRRLSPTTLPRRFHIGA